MWHRLCVGDFKKVTLKSVFTLLELLSSLKWEEHAPKIKA